MIFNIYESVKKDEDFLLGYLLCMYLKDKGIVDFTNKKPEELDKNFDISLTIDGEVVDLFEFFDSVGVAIEQHVEELLEEKKVEEKKVEENVDKLVNEKVQKVLNDALKTVEGKVGELSSTYKLFQSIVRSNSKSQKPKYKPNRKRKKDENHWKRSY